MPANEQDSSSSSSASGFHPAMAITNIKHMIPITLNSDQDQYSTWVELFTVTATAADVLDHIDPAVPRPSSISDPLWNRLDAIVKQWLYATISPALLQTILKPKSTAQQTWNRIRDLFEDNKSTRILNLESKFSAIQLDQYPNCTEYCHAIKVISDQLANLGSPLDDNKLVLRLIKGLHNTDYKSVATFIAQSDPLPSFSKARSMLLLEETNHETAPPPATAFVASRTNVSPPAAGQSAVQPHSKTVASTPQQNTRNNTHNNRGRGNNTNNNNYRGRNNNNKGRDRNYNQQAYFPYPYFWPPTPWTAPPCPYPTTGSIAPRPNASSSAGILGPAPPQVHAAMTPTQLADSFATMQFNPPDDNWYMDTGATTHLTNTAGSQDGGSHPEMS